MNNDPDNPSSEQRGEAGRYWNAHPIATSSVPFEKGTEESFDAIFERWERDVTPRRLEFLKSCSGKKLLEIGCGIGIDGRFFSSNGAEYQAVDMSRESLKLAQKHFNMKDLVARFTNGDATRLPFEDNSFDVVYSSGVLHHIPDMKAACREAVRVLRPGGTARVMLYHKASYHYWLVHYAVRPLVWLLLKLPGGDAIANRLPSKFRETYEICRDDGFDADRILSISTDTSGAGEANYNPLSYFVTADDVRELFAGLEDFEFYTTDLKYFPLPFWRRAVEDRWGFFLQIKARKPGGK
ncbi:MAG: SAM-dependent methyltransferase [Myxococcota bacterium]|jgi:SAM-dependent methyltransferase